MRVRYKVRLENGRLRPLVRTESIPQIKNGAIVELLISSDDLLDGSKQRLLNRERVGPILKVGETLIIRLRRAEKFHLKDNDPIETRDGVQDIKLRLLEPLYFIARGDDRKLACYSCKCELLLGSERRQADSLNEAYTIASVLYEPKRRAHSGNVFRDVYYHDHGSLRALGNLRESE